MFLERMSRFRHSLGFRLTLLYIVTFTLSIFIGSFIFYQLMISKIQVRTDKFLQAKMKEFSSLLSSKGLAALEDEMVRDSEAMGIDKVLFRLITPEGKEIVTSNPSLWKGVGISRIVLNSLAEKGPVFETLKLPDWTYKVRILYGIAGPGKILQIGQSLEEDELFLESFKEVFGAVMVILLTFAALGGWFMARRSLSGVEKLTQTAMAITGGAMEKRVPLTGRGDEIDRLSGVFNHMLERIQSLIVGMKEVTDNVAHDIKSPITRIRGLAEITLVGGKTLDEYRAMAANTIEESDRLLKILNTMLQISQTEAGAVSLNLSEMDVSSLIEEACDLFQALAEEKGLSLEVTTSRPCLVRCDKNRLQQALINLLDNAVKYTPSGKITISADQDDTKVMISVRDTGVGISTDEIPHLFDRFFRADKSRSVPGSGLGLSLVRAIVHKHGGAIRVSSSPGIGSTFTIDLPKSNILP
jgi:heavy metal sensor kinase